MIASGGQGYGHLGRIDVERLATNTAQMRLGAADLPPWLKNSLITAEYLRDAYLGVHFGRAQNLRLELRRQIDEALAGVDLLVMPTVPTVAFELLGDRVEPEVLAGRIGAEPFSNTCPLDLSGHPALTVPCGLGEHGLPVGLQIVGRHFDECQIYEAGSAFEAACAFKVRRQAADRDPSVTARTA